jgi:hypothetical protein
MIQKDRRDTGGMDTPTARLICPRRAESANVIN